MCVCCAGARSRCVCACVCVCVCVLDTSGGQRRPHGNARKWRCEGAREHSSKKRIKEASFLSKRCFHRGAAVPLFSYTRATPPRLQTTSPRGVEFACLCGCVCVCIYRYLTRARSLSLSLSISLLHVLARMRYRHHHYRRKAPQSTCVPITNEYTFVPCHSGCLVEALRLCGGDLREAQPVPPSHPTHTCTATFGLRCRNHVSCSQLFDLVQSHCK